VIGRVRAAISRQLSLPSGRAGRVVAALMNRGNRGLNDRAIALLDVRPGHRVLDLGFGGGLTFAPLLAAGATVVGVDRAADMVRAARGRHEDDVAAGRLALHAGDVLALPLEDASVDRVITVNTVYFWPDLPAALAEIRRVLAPSGRLVIGVRDGSVMRQVNLEVFTLRTPAELATALEDAGLAGVSVHSAPDGATHLIAADRDPPVRPAT
jgi:SAM-dependent methyltransferase